MPVISAKTRNLPLRAIACAGLTLLASGGAVAADELSSEVKNAMRRDLGLSSQQLGQYLKFERAAATEEAAAKRALGASYAGSWLERGADGSFRQVVATSGSGKALAGRKGIELRRVRHSLSHLNDTMASLDRGAKSRIPGISKSLDGVRAWYVDQATNSVVVELAPGATDAAVDFVAASSADAGAVRFETSQGEQQAMAAITVAGGFEYTYPVGQYTSYCSVGFMVMQNEHKGYATAGHCGKAGQQVWIAGNLTGHFVLSDFPKSDKAWVTVYPEHTIAPWVVDYNHNNFITVKGSVPAPVGAVVCRSGRTTGTRCGTITAINVTTQANTSAGVVTWSGVTRTNACGGKGDSGGSFFTPAGQAQGVTSTANLLGPEPFAHNCMHSQNKVQTHFTPINPILSTYSLTLVTG
ncbi:S1 family peptidase [Lysobacter sp. Root604]|uniref:S1 family peptidase n=1 Tax=Lysobacter sp. Root604 TaxID=1736568 RepID=UPI0009E93208|nr:S1 family peptidase [Lysobacter sp. Root604]